MVKVAVPFPFKRNSHTSFPVRQFLFDNSSGAALLRLNNSSAVTLFRVDSCTGAVLETDLTAALVQPQSGAERRRVLAVDFDYVSPQWKRICDDDKMLLSLIVYQLMTPILYFKIVELSLSVYVCVYTSLLLYIFYLLFTYCFVVVVLSVVVFLFSIRFFLLLFSSFLFLSFS